MKIPFNSKQQISSKFISLLFITTLAISLTQVQSMSFKLQGA